MIESVAIIEEDAEELRLMTTSSQVDARELRRAVGLQTFPFRTILPIVDRIPNDFNSDFYICPMAFNGCEHAKSPGFYSRCAGSDYPYMNCDLWDGDVTQEKPISRYRNRTNTGQSSDERSFHDALADGDDPIKLGEKARALFRDLSEYKSLRENVWPNWSEELARIIREA